MGDFPIADVLSHLSLFTHPIYLPEFSHETDSMRSRMMSNQASKTMNRVVSGFGIWNIYIYIIYTPNLGLRVAVFIREREQGRFRGSTKEARRRSKGALRELEGLAGCA